MVKSVGLQGHDFVLEDLPHRFEAGTPHIAGVIGMGAAIDYLEKVGMDEISAYDKVLSEKLFTTLSELDELKIYPDYKPAVERLGIASFRIEGLSQDDVASILSDRFNIMLRSGFHCAELLVRHFGVDGLLRASLHLYNTEEEITYMIQALKKIIGSFFYR